MGLAVVSYIQTSYWSSNETLYTRSLAVTENNFLIEQNYCYALMKQERLDEAERLCRSSLEHRPNYFEALNTLGIISFKRMDFPNAEALFKGAIRAGGYHPLTYSNLALAQIVQGRPAEGEVNLRKAVELSEGQVSPLLFVDPLTTLVDQYLKQGNFEKASENLKRLRFLQPEKVETRMKLIEMQIQLKQYAGVSGGGDRGSSRNGSNNADAWNALGLFLLGKAQNKEAADAFNRALTLRPDYKDAKENLKKARVENSIRRLTVSVRFFARSMSAGC